MTDKKLISSLQGLRSAMAFSLQKIRKLYLLHLIMMAAALLLVLKGLLAQPSTRGVLSCAAQLVVSIFLLQTWIPSSRFWFCLNGVAWYLSVQAFLYAIFPPLLVVLKKADARRLRCIAAVIFCAQCLASFVFWKVGLSGKAAFSSPPRRWGFWARWPSGTMCCLPPLRCCWSGCLPWARGAFPGCFPQSRFCNAL